MSSLRRHLLSPHVLITAVVVCVGLSSFALGRFSVERQYQAPASIQSMTLPTPSASGDLIVASKNSTKYHYSWCAGARRIKEENMVTFRSAAAAEAAGYEPAQNCPGL